MLAHEDLKWLAANATELNRLLQQATRQVEQARLLKGKAEPLEALDQQLERASRTSQAIFDRITTRILAAADANPGTVERTRPPVAPAHAGQASISTKMPIGEITLNGDAAAEPRILNPTGDRELILLVDDDPELLETTGEFLDFEDYRFITAKDGMEALKIYRRMGKKIDLILLDYFLPVMDGDVVFEELKAINPDVRVVLTSGFGEQARVGSMLAQGLAAFIPKPYTHQRLVEQIRSVLDA
jgi:CheY-like chemotaxis protein